MIREDRYTPVNLLHKISNQEFFSFQSDNLVKLDEIIYRLVLYYSYKGLRIHWLNLFIFPVLFVLLILSASFFYLFFTLSYMFLIFNY